MPKKNRLCRAKGSGAVRVSTAIASVVLSLAGTTALAVTAQPMVRATTYLSTACGEDSGWITDPVASASANCSGQNVAAGLYQSQISGAEARVGVLSASSEVMESAPTGQMGWATSAPAYAYFEDYLTVTSASLPAGTVVQLRMWQAVDQIDDRVIAGPGGYLFDNGTQSTFTAQIYAAPTVDYQLHHWGSDQGEQTTVTDTGPLTITATVGQTIRFDGVLDVSAHVYRSAQSMADYSVSYHVDSLTPEAMLVSASGHVYAVPEPAEWALLSSGLIVVLAGVRRGRGTTLLSS